MTLASPLCGTPGETAHQGNGSYALKRSLDVGLALILLPFASLLLVVLALAICATSPGPAVFRQVRVGRNGRPFACLKLRTMRRGTASLPSHEVSASAVTRIGCWLRASKLDELPQLWNILVGEMSFVGPRPCLPIQTGLVEARRRLGLEALRPGVTGVAQVAGIDMRDVESLAVLDATYLAGMSLRQDFWLLIRTIFGAGRGDRVGGTK
jgi:O-antigen biosynthesis protein WbqP